MRVPVVYLRSGFDDNVCAFAFFIVAIADALLRPWLPVADNATHLGAIVAVIRTVR